MKRSILNSVFYALFFGALPIQITSFICEQCVVWLFLCLPVLFFAVKSQDYLYQKNGKTFYRRIPFFKAIAVDQINEIDDLKLIDTSATVQSLWLQIEQARA